MKVYKEYIEKSFDNTEDLFEYLNSDEEPQELIRCKDCKYYFKSDEKCQLIDTRLHFYEEGKRWFEDSFCSWAERKDEYVTLHHDDIHFKDEESEKAFYESLAERKAGEHLLYIPLPHKSERILEKDILAKGAERKEE